MAEPTPAVTPAEARRWREFLERLECWELIYGEALAEEAWDDLAPELESLAPGAERDVATIKARGEVALLEIPVRPSAPSAAGADDAVSEPSADVSGHQHLAPHAPEQDAEPEREVVLEAAPPGAYREPDPEDAPSESPADRAVAQSSEQPTRRARVSERVAAPAAAAQSSARPDRPMRWADIAVAVLEASRTQMTAREILEWSQKNGPSRPTTGKTPAQSINRDLHAAIRKRYARLRAGDRPGTFTLERGETRSTG